MLRDKYVFRNLSAVTTELSQLLRLGLPLIGAQLAQISVNTMDVLMIGWLGAEDLAASVLVFNYYIVLWLTGLGIILAAAPLSAQAYGAHDLRTMRRVIRQGFWARGHILNCFNVHIIFYSPSFAVFGSRRTHISAS